MRRRRAAVDMIFGPWDTLELPSLVYYVRRLQLSRWSAQLGFRYLTLLDLWTTRT